jgi:amidohydrolase
MSQQIPTSLSDSDSAIRDRIRNIAAREHSRTVEIRRHLHANPELSFEEEQTASYVAAELQELGIPFEKGIGGHGIRATLKGNGKSNRVLALRADMDALPIQEANEVDYRSKVDGVMHACGHDAHTASLLGVARILSEMSGELDGDIRFIFQPAEERFPGGASLMIRDGILQNPEPVSVIGQHVFPQLEAGTVGFRPGIYMAAADELYFTVKGKGGHGAYPHLTIDPVLMMAELINSLQRVVSRFAQADKPAVLSVGKVIANGATNIIPEVVKLDGTFRSFDQELRFAAHEEIRRIARGVAEAHGGTIETEIKVGYPPLLNHEELTVRLRTWAEEFLGKDSVVDLPISMGAEDFAYYSQETSACFYRLGTGNTERGIKSPIHTPTFDIDEASLEVGPGLMAWMAVQELRQQ